jgi:tetraacyldisaccharide 4'-kinase
MNTRRPWAQPLVPLYRAAQGLENALLRRGFPATRSLTMPVLSIGSLSAGGAGKTPVVLAFAQMLTSAGWQPDILTRGYGRSGKRIDEVSIHASTAELLAMAEAERTQRLDALCHEEPSAPGRRARRVMQDGAAARFGDEAVLLAARAQVPVWVGSDRYQAGLAAERSTQYGRGVHLLDDGFQHRTLERALDVVLITSADLEDALLPAGNLREPLTALARADAVIVREEEMDLVAPKVWPRLREGAQMWTVRRTLRFPAPLGVLTAGLRPLAFCAIARPEGFAASLAGAGCAVIDTVVFYDHQALAAKQLQEIAAFAKQLNATGLITTEKDFVKLAPAAICELQRNVGPLMVASLDAEILDVDRVLPFVEAALTARPRR